MILTNGELAAYRRMVGLQVQFAQLRDSHKVMDLQIQLEKWISTIARLKVEVATGKLVDLEWSDVARATYRKKCADAMVKSDQGFAEWSKAQMEIEMWVSVYIEQAIMQATVRIDTTIRNTN